MPLPLPIEFMFSRLVIEEAIEEGILVLQPRVARIASEELPLEVDVDSVIQGRIDDRFRYLAKAVSSESKTNFSQWIVQKNADAFEPFRPLFEDISAALVD
jgi:hypothetical protein